ncbi:MAG: HAD-IIIA family hydrolase [Pseudomonadota bacterium]
MRSVMFDLDGTLADTSGDLLAAANVRFRALGLGDLLTPEDAGTAVKGGRAMLRLGFSRVIGFDEADVDAQYLPFIDAYAQNLDTHTYLYPGAMDAVAKLKSQGYAVGICTNKPIRQAEDLMKRLGVRDQFDSLLGADSLPVRKPDPEHLREAVRQAGGDPEQTILIGDTQTDRDTARNAGVPCVLVTFGPGDDDVAALKPEGLLHSYGDLPALVAQLIG